MQEDQTVKERLISYIFFIRSSQRRFEKECGLSNGYINNIRKSISTKKLYQIIQHHPDLNRDWLLYGEGPMLKENITQHANGDNNTQIAGNGNLVEMSSSLKLAIEEIAEQRKLVSKSQEQIDRLLAIIEKMQS